MRSVLTYSKINVQKPEELTNKIGNSEAGMFVPSDSKVLVWILLALCGCSNDAGAVEKRSDDVNPMENVLQQQASVIQQQAADLAALHSAVEQLRVRVDKAVSFTVYSSKDPLETGDHEVFVFDTAVSNIGNAYDTVIGIFTAPYSGTYLFLANIVIPNNNNYIQIAIDKSGTLLALAHSESNNDQWDKGTCHVTVHLAAGDKVWVRHKAGRAQLTGGMWSTFSGTLVHAD